MGLGRLSPLLPPVLLFSLPCTARYVIVLHISTKALLPRLPHLLVKVGTAHWACQTGHPAYRRQGVRMRFGPLVALLPHATPPA